MTRATRAIMLSVFIALAVLAGLAAFRPPTYRGPYVHPAPSTSARPSSDLAISRDFLRPALLFHKPAISPSAVSLSSRPAERPSGAAPTGTATNNSMPAGRVLSGDSVFWAGALKLRMCESSNNYADKYNKKYRGAYQIGFHEWQVDLGGTGDPADASPAEQDARALRLWRARGWSPWYSSSGCSHLR